MRSRQIRRIFIRSLFQQLRIVWPIFSGILLVMIGPGLVIGRIEGWRISDALYFTFVTGLTIGYGDLTPRHYVSRFLAVLIGFAGIVLTGLVAAVSVKALNTTARNHSDEQPDARELDRQPQYRQDEKEGDRDNRNGIP